MEVDKKFAAIIYQRTLDIDEILIERASELKIRNLSYTTIPRETNSTVY